MFGAIGLRPLLDRPRLGTLGVTRPAHDRRFRIPPRADAARDRFHAPYLSVAVVTILYAYGQILLRFVLGEPAAAGIVTSELPVALLLNLLLTLPVYGLARRLFPPSEHLDRVREVRLLG